MTDRQCLQKTVYRKRAARDAVDTKPKRHQAYVLYFQYSVMSFPLIFHKNGVEKILIHFATSYLLFKRGRIIPFPHKTIKRINCKIIVGGIN